MARRVVVTRAGGREKRPVLLTLAFVAVAALGFVFGVMVGSNDSEPEIKAPPRVAILPPTGQPADPVGDQLTFYNNLPRGEQTPLGSGINPPPSGTEPAALKAPAPAVVKPAVVVAEVKKTTAPAVVPVATSTAKEVATAAPDTTLYLVQAASFRERGGAEALAKKMHKLQIATFVQAADLGDKGQWFRVYSGPFVGKAAADQAVKIMRKEFKLSPVVRKQS
ncbi:MAG: SPOR domain-containing protein [Desulfuromonadales bacterium]|nr:SPOR domain-containing protein [Desulfuromonadales bacterium]